MAGQEHPGVLHRWISFTSPAVVLDGALKLVLTFALLGELGVVFFSIPARSLFHRAWVWPDEVARLALSVLAFLGGAFAYRRGEHAFLRTLIDVLPLGGRRVCYALVEFCVLVIAITTGLSSLPLFAAQQSQLTPILQIRMSWFVLPLVAGMAVLALTAIEHLLSQHRPTVLAVGGAFATVVLLLILTRATWRPWVADSAALSALGLFFFPALLGLPVGFALLLGAFGYLYVAGTVPMVALPHTMISGVSSFVFLAIPFFIFAGIIMNQGGISLRLVRCVRAFVGHFRGGLYQVMVVSMYIVSGLSGSKIADVAALGSVMRDMLRREGYSLDQATAVLAASAVMGETVPPSICMLVLGSITALSIAGLFLAGLIPAAAVGVCLMTLIYLQARRANTQRTPRASLRQLARASLGGVLPILMPVILFGGILLGVATPTEVSSFAVVYGLVLAALIYRDLGFRAFAKGVIDCAAVSGMILFILAAASCFAWTLTVAGLPHRLVGLLTSTRGSQTLFLLASILLLIVAGSILDGLPALLILGPILLPIAGQVGVSQLHYGIVLIIAMGVGLFMPPLGVGFYVTCAVCETTIESASRRMIPFLLVLLLGLVLVALVPWLTLFLPVAFHLISG